MHLRFPFDWKTPSGYLVAWIAQLVGLFALYTAVIPFFIFIFGLCWLFNAIVRDISVDSSVAFKNIKMTADGYPDAESIERICDAIQLHSDAKQYVNFPFKIFASFVCVSMTMACASFRYSLSGVSTNSMRLIDIHFLHYFSGLFWVFQWIFFRIFRCFNHADCVFPNAMHQP